MAPQRGQLPQQRPNGLMVQPTLNRLRGFTEEITELGYQPSSVVLARDRVRSRPASTLSDALPDAPFLRLERVRKADSMAMSHETAWYDLTAAPCLAATDGSMSIYALLRAAGKPLVRCEQTIEAVLPTPQHMDVFGFPCPVPCLLIRRRSYAANGRLIEYVEGIFRGDAYVLHVGLQAAQTATAGLQTLRERFHLTPAEMRVAQEIVKGEGRMAAAKRIGIGEATLKSHLIHIFEKTGVTRQAELVRLIHEGP
ncbi:MAG: UTRA domain-containing protein [Burkholderiaceae bacterium]|nr:UTRA domain-containing protein [Burkholderiaceae bacterium]